MKSYRIEPEELVTSTNGANVELQTYDRPGSAIDMHIHSSIEALYILRGSFEVLANDVGYELCAGELFLMRKYTAHSVNVLSEDGGAYYVLKIHPSVIEDFAAAENATTFQFFFSLDSKEQKCLWSRAELEASDILPPLAAIAREYGEDDIFSFTSLKLNMGKLLLAIMRDSYMRSPSNFEFMKFGDNMISLIQRAIEHVNLNYAENLTTRETAKMLNLSYNYFSGCFSRVTGKSFKQYLNQTRINYAKSLIINSDLTVSRVGEAVGFSSASHFILEFRRRTGMTPLEFAKNIKRRQM